MKLLRYILVIGLLYMAMEATAQSVTHARPPEKSAVINQLDAKGRRQGMWVVNEDARMGEEPYMAFGNYTQGDKLGAWYKLNTDGDLMAIENYKNNVLDGEAKYYENGRLIAVGHYRGLNPDHAMDTFLVVDPTTGAESLRSIATEKGSMRHGIWQFYNPENGRLTREEDYQVDNLIYSKEFGMTAADSVYYKKREANLPHNKKQKHSLFGSR